MPITGVILAAGKGTRLQPLTFAIPKEMVHVNGKALVQHAVELLKAGGITNVIVIVGSKKGALMDFLKDGKWLGVDVAYRFQEELSGVATAVHMAKPLIGGTFAVTFGDEIIEPKDRLVKELIDLHKRTGATCTLGVSEVTDPERYGVAKLDGKGKVIDLIEKPQTAEELDYLRSDGKFYGLNGVFILEPEIFQFIEKIKPGAKNEYQLTDAIRLALKSGKTVSAVAHRGLYRDVGTFDALIETEKEMLRL
jgi:bifunctional UDP-N-acetylglucosamine pyrophosphorylase/glucosamine-1-phosphate N-acetyltransferase